MATTNMTLILPTVSATLGPLWATELNTALTLVDSHDHSTGKGVKITPSGLNINTDLSLQSNDLTLVRTVALNSQAATLSASDVRAVYSVLGDLYWNNGSGTAVQITSGASVQSSASTISRAFERLAVNANKTILAGDAYSYLDTDTGSSVTYTLPAANSVSAGRFYEFKDSTGQAATNNITINRAGADTIDGATSLVINTNYGCNRLVSDGSTKWETSRVSQIDTFLSSVKIPRPSFNWNSADSSQLIIPATSLNPATVKIGNSLYKNTSNLVLDLDTAGANGLDTGAKAGQTVYYIYAILPASGTTFRGCFSVSPPTTGPTGFGTNWSYLGSCFTTAGYFDHCFNYVNGLYMSTSMNSPTSTINVSPMTSFTVTASAVAKSFYLHASWISGLAVGDVLQIGADAVSSRKYTALIATSTTAANNTTSLFWAAASSPSVIFARCNNTAVASLAVLGWQENPTDYQ